MRIAIVTHFFHPSVGGTEQVAQMLATGFVKLGHEVRVVTSTPLSPGNAEPKGRAGARRSRGRPPVRIRFP